MKTPEPETDAFRYFYHVTVQAADIDFNHHANNVVYVRWIQEAGTAHWESAVPEEIAKEYMWVVVRHEIDYKKPALLGDRLRVETWVEPMGKLLSARYCQVVREADRQVLARSKTQFCALDPATEKPRRLDPRLNDFLGATAAKE